MAEEDQRSYSCQHPKNGGVAISPGELLTSSSWPDSEADSLYSAMTIEEVIAISYC